MEKTLLGGRYQVLRRLGSGGFSRTFLVSDLHLPNHPKCVIKQLKIQDKDTSTLEMARRLFDTEARVLYRLGSHPQIPSLLAHFEESREFYLAQEYIEGSRLNRQNRRGQALVRNAGRTAAAGSAGNSFLCASTAGHSPRYQTLKT